MVTRKLGAIIAAGCTTIIKPAEDTPLSLLKFIEITQHLIPPGVINVVTASRDNTPAMGRVICNDSRIKSITFTGSSEVGKVNRKIIYAARDRYVTNGRYTRFDVLASHRHQIEYRITDMHLDLNALPIMRL